MGLAVNQVAVAGRDARRLVDDFLRVVPEPSVGYVILVPRTLAKAVSA
jgi:hypothetical protein